MREEYLPIHIEGEDEKKKEKNGKIITSIYTHGRKVKQITYYDLSIKNGGTLYAR